MQRNRLLQILVAVSALGYALGQQFTPECGNGIPNRFTGRWFSLDGDGGYVYHELNSTTMRVSTSLDFDQGKFTGECFRMELRKDAVTGQDDILRVLYRSKQKNGAFCYTCFRLVSRTPNILESQSRSCSQARNPGIEPTIEHYCMRESETVNTQGIIMFLKDYKKVDCQETWWGIYHFTYKLRDIQQVCDSSDSIIKSCYDPGTPYVGNELIKMEWGSCPGFKQEFRSQTYKCLGSWLQSNEDRFAAIWDITQREDKFAYICLRTSETQQLGDNEKRWAMSRIASCKDISSIFDSHYSLVLTPTIPKSTVVVPRCRFPANFTGQWYTSAERDSSVTINETHIHFNTKLDQYNMRDDYYVCQQHSDSRFLTTKVSLGLCEIDFICFDFMARHQNIIRFRWSKPFAYSEEEMMTSTVDDYMERKYRGACSWVSFNLRSNEVNWKYRTLMLYPPVPVECPIAGQYKFVQSGEELIKTRYRGITEVPRMQVLCREIDLETSFSACKDTKILKLDNERCMMLDHHARPIGEYDIPDHELVCVGNWMEDIQSYMITYERDDSVSPFRCWVYRQYDYRRIELSRSTRSACGFHQTSSSVSIEEGASLHLMLEENERIHDECDQRFDLGRYTQPEKAQYHPMSVDYSKNSAPTSSFFGILTTTTTLFLILERLL